MAALIELWVPERQEDDDAGEEGAGAPPPQGTLFAGIGSPVAAAPPPSDVGAPARHLAVFATQRWRWAAAGAFVALHLGLTLGVRVPSWTSAYGYHARASDSLGGSRYLLIAS